jgi:Biotin-lipoyl like
MVAVAPFFAVSWNKWRDLSSAGHLPSPHCTSSRGREFRALRIGAHVEAGQLLASIDTPNLDQQFAQAKADLLPPLLLHQLAAVTAERWNAWIKSQWTARQPTDCKTGAAAAKKATMDAASVNMKRFEAMGL